MATLLLWLKAPMQAWGTTSQFDERDTQLEPSKSGVIGMLCAALGRDRSEPVEDLSSLKMGVRVVSEGELMRDYQTAQGVIKANSKVDKERVVITPRYYLADAAFLVGLEGDNLELLTTIHKALLKPVWSLCFGRKGFPPSAPVFIKDGIRNTPLKDSLKQYQIEQNGSRQTYRLILENDSEGSMRLDQPIAPFSERRFGQRYVLTELVNIEDENTKAGGEHVFIDG